MRTLHTLKGGARLAGAMRLGEMAHRLETRIERLTASDAATPGAADVETLQTLSDAMTQAFEALRSRDAQAYADAVAAVVMPAVQAVRRQPACAPVAPTTVAANDSLRVAAAGAGARARARSRAGAQLAGAAEPRSRGRRRSAP